MIWALLSSRVRTWLIFAFVLPFVGRLLERLGRRTATSRPGLSKALESSGRRMQAPRGRRQRRL